MGYMASSTQKNAALFVAAMIVVLPLACFFGNPFGFWILFGLTVLNVVIWTALAIVQFVNRARFGANMTLDEILNEGDPDRRLRLIRYHLGWSPAKIAGELNRRGVTNQGLPWRQDDVRRAVKRIGGRL